MLNLDVKKKKKSNILTLCCVSERDPRDPVSMVTTGIEQISIATISLSCSIGVDVKVGGMGGKLSYNI